MKIKLSLLFVLPLILLYTSGNSQITNNFENYATINIKQTTDKKTINNTTIIQNIVNTFSVQGVLIGDSGKKVTRARISLYNDAEKLKETVTDENGVFLFDTLLSTNYYMLFDLGNASNIKDALRAPIFIRLSLDDIDNPRALDRSINLNKLVLTSFIVDTDAKIVINLDGKRIYSNYGRYKCGSDFNDIFRMGQKYTEMQWYVTDGYHDYEIYSADLKEKYEKEDVCEQIFTKELIFKSNENFNGEKKVYVKSGVINDCQYLSPHLIDDTEYISYKYSLRTIGYRNQRINVNLQYKLDDGSLSKDLYSKTVIADSEIQTHEIIFNIPTSTFKEKKTYIDNFYITDKDGKILSQNSLWLLYRNSQNALNRIQVYGSKEETKRKIWIGKIEACFNQNQFSNAQSTIEKLLNEFPDEENNPLITLFQGVIYLNTDKSKDAEKILYKLMNSDYEDYKYDAQYYYGEALIKQEKLAELESLAKSHPYWKTIEQNAYSLFSQKRFSEAAYEMFRVAEYAEKSNFDSILVAKLYGNTSWFQLFSKNYDNAISSALKGISFDISQKWIETNLAHGLLLSQKKDNISNAMEIYLRNKGIKIDNKTWEEVIESDFNFLKTEGVSCSEMKMVIKKLKRGK